MSPPLGVGMGALGSAAGLGVLRRPGRPVPPPVAIPAVVVEVSPGVYAFDTDPAAVRAGYIVSDGSGGYQIDTLAASGLNTFVLSGRPFVEV